MCVEKNRRKRIFWGVYELRTISKKFFWRHSKCKSFAKTRVFCYFSSIKMPGKKIQKSYIFIQVRLFKRLQKNFAMLCRARIQLKLCATLYTLYRTLNCGPRTRKKKCTTKWINLPKKSIKKIIIRKVFWMQKSKNYNYNFFYNLNILFNNYSLTECKKFYKM